MVYVISREGCYLIFCVVDFLDDLEPLECRYAWVLDLEDLTTCGHPFSTWQAKPSNLKTSESKNFPKP